MKTQLDWDRFYLHVAETAAKLSYDHKTQVGCVIAKDGNILSFSYNGTLPGSPNILRDEFDKTKETVMHAEAMALMKAVKSGVSCNGATAYITLAPCIECSKLMVAAGIERVVYLRTYKCMEGVELLAEHGIRTCQYTTE